MANLMKPVKQQDQNNLKCVAEFIWNIADDRLGDVCVRGKCRDLSISLKPTNQSPYNRRKA